jgi:hypothetical protein
MTENDGTVRPSGHPVPALTTFELRDYRRELERALASLPGHAPVRGLLEGQLAEVQAEQDARAAVRSARP